MVTDRLTLVLSLPLYTERSVDHSISEAVHDPNHRDLNGARQAARLTTSGIGDLQLNARYLVRRGLIGSFGLQIPTGDDDRIDELGRRADPMLQPGTGALALSSGVVDGRARSARRARRGARRPATNATSRARADIASATTPSCCGRCRGRSGAASPAPSP